MSPENPVRCDVIFRGRVQGVGFRQTVTVIATSFPVSGYVMNLRDGSVLMVAEGLRPVVSALIQGVLSRMHGFATGHEVRWGTATGEFPDFTIRYESR